jgi:acyl-CoA thioesterase
MPYANLSLHIRPPEKKTIMDDHDIRTLILHDPYMNFLGITIDIMEAGHARCSVTITQDMLNFHGMVHGGLVFSLADVAFSIAANYDYLPSYALDVSGSFIQTAHVGDRITADAQIIHTTKRTGVYRMDVRHASTLIATFNGTVFRKRGNSVVTPDQ